MKYSNTEQRRILLEELRSLKTHPTAEELFQRVRQRLNRISLATIYRNLDRLAEAGNVKKLEQAGDVMRFDGDLSPHLHLRCRRCGAVEDLKLGETTELMTLAACLCKGRIETASVEFQGLCSRCAEKETERKGTPPEPIKCLDRRKERMERMSTRIFKCEQCGVVAETILNPEKVTADLKCPGSLKEMVPRREEPEKGEKHLPVPKILGDGTTRVSVGSLPHPMEKEHYIAWIELVEGDRTERVYLHPNGIPEADFFLPLKPGVIVREYCTIHGLWEYVPKW